MLSIRKELVGARGLATKKFDRVMLCPGLFGSGRVIGWMMPARAELLVSLPIRVASCAIFAASRPASPREMVVAKVESLVVLSAVEMIGIGRVPATLVCGPKLLLEGFARRARRKFSCAILNS